jgi:hypothetical protein
MHAPAALVFIAATSCMRQTGGWGHAGQGWQRQRQTGVGGAAAPDDTQFGNVSFHREFTGGVSKTAIAVRGGGGLSAKWRGPVGWPACGWMC